MVLAAAVNLVVYFVARAAGADLVIRQDGAADHAIAAGDVLFSSAVPLLGGTLLAVLLARAWGSFLRLAQVVGGGLGILSAAGPLLGGSDTGTKIGLAVMHVVVGLTVIGVLETVLRRNRAGA